jgi:non-homologous end joining protein Ku
LGSTTHISLTHCPDATQNDETVTLEVMNQRYDTRIRYQKITKDATSNVNGSSQAATIQQNKQENDG